jgi:AcrR family transcriptional regulator
VAKITREKSLQRRSDILGAVYDVISIHGVGGLNMRLLAATAKISTGTITYHFGSKQKLLIAALQDAYSLPADWETYSGSPIGQLERLLSGYVFRSSRDRFWRFWIEFIAQGTRNNELMKSFQERFERQQRFWTKLIRDGIHSGEIKKDTNVEEAVETLLLTCHGLIIRQLANPSEKARTDADKILKKIVRRLRQ